MLGTQAYQAAAATVPARSIRPRSDAVGARAARQLQLPDGCPVSSSAVAFVTLAVTLTERFGLNAHDARGFWPEFRRGGMAEWSMAVVLKTTVPGRVPGVRIPLPPPTFPARLEFATNRSTPPIAFT
jgi:hypothetical protein